MKDLVSALKKARNKCADTVDKRTLDELDSVIEKLESESKDGHPSKRMGWLSVALKAYALLKLLAGFTDDDDM